MLSKQNGSTLGPLFSAIRAPCASNKFHNHSASNRRHARRMATVHQIAQKGFGSGTNELYDRYVVTQAC